MKNFGGAEKIVNNMELFLAFNFNLRDYTQDLMIENKSKIKEVYLDRFLDRLIYHLVWKYPT